MLELIDFSSILAAGMNVELNDKAFGMLGGVIGAGLIVMGAANGIGNLAPFSYFTIGGSNPPSCVICPINNRHGAEKDTLHNIEQTNEYVISVVTHQMAKQMNQTAYAYEPEIDEFEKTSFTKEASAIVAPPRVKESPLSIECRLHTIVRHGEGALASNYIIGEVLMMHVDESVMIDGLPDNTLLDTISRLGASWYGTTKPSSLFELERPDSP